MRASALRDLDSRVERAANRAEIDLHHLGTRVLERPRAKRLALHLDREVAEPLLLAGLAPPACGENGSTGIGQFVMGFEGFDRVSVVC